MKFENIKWVCKIRKGLSTGKCWRELMRVQMDMKLEKG